MNSVQAEAKTPIHIRQGVYNTRVNIVDGVVVVEPNDKRITPLRFAEWVSYNGFTHDTTKWHKRDKTYTTEQLWADFVNRNNKELLYL
jgi:hypothetical protein